MKRALSIFILIMLLFLVFEFGATYFKEGHEVSYQVFFEDKVFDIEEVYSKENGNTYDIQIKIDDNIFYYTFSNNYNKRKKIITGIEYYQENNDTCIYPILETKEGTYLQCMSNGKLYSKSSYTNQNLLNIISKSLNEKGYLVSKSIDLNNTKTSSNSTIYVNNLLEDDIITFWTYKGILTTSKENIISNNVLGFDKYENQHGYLVDHYYIIPNYLNSRVQEFNEVKVINLKLNEKKEIKLDYTLSSSTYINGIIDGKLYYTDPSNLLQLEINPSKNSSRLIGSKDIGGQMYDGSWSDRNIYDFVNNKIKFETKLPDNLLNYSYTELKEGASSYYFYNSNGEVYQVPKNHLDKNILLFKTNGISNFKVIGDTLYYVVDNTLYYYSNEDGSVPVIKNNELRYNKNNRIDVYRKS